MLTEIAAHPLFYVLFPILGAVAGFGTMFFGWLLAYAPTQSSALAKKPGTLSSRIARLVAAEISAQELLSRLDPQSIAQRLESPIRKLVDETTVDLMQRYKPDLWELLPMRVKRTIIDRARAKAPALASSILGALESDAGDVLILEQLVSRVLRENPVLLAQFGREISTPLRIVNTRRGTLLGLVIGVLEIPLVAMTHSGILAAIAPIVLTFLSRYFAGLALQRDLKNRQPMLAIPFAERIANPVLSCENIIAELVGGARSERVRQIVRREVTDAIDDQASVAKPLVSATIGADAFQHIKHGAAERVIETAPALTKPVEDYAEESMQVRSSLSYRLRRTPVERLLPVYQCMRSLARARGYLIALLTGIVCGAVQFGITAVVLGVS